VKKTRCPEIGRSLFLGCRKTPHFWPFFDHFWKFKKRVSEKKWIFSAAGTPRRTRPGFWTHFPLYALYFGPNFDPVLTPSGTPFLARPPTARKKLDFPLVRYCAEPPEIWWFLAKLDPSRNRTSTQGNLAIFKTRKIGKLRLGGEA